jgi:hypothetical protein
VDDAGKLTIRRAGIRRGAVGLGGPRSGVPGDGQCPSAIPIVFQDPAEATESEERGRLLPCLPRCQRGRISRRHGEMKTPCQMLIMMFVGWLNEHHPPSSPTCGIGFCGSSSGYGSTTNNGGGWRALGSTTVGGPPSRGPDSADSAAPNTRPHSAILIQSFIAARIHRVRKDEVVSSPTRLSLPTGSP